MKLSEIHTFLMKVMSFENNIFDRLNKTAKMQFFIYIQITVLQTWNLYKQTLEAERHYSIQKRWCRMPRTKYEGISIIIDNLKRIGRAISFYEKPWRSFNYIQWNVNKLRPRLRNEHELWADWTTNEYRNRFHLRVRFKKKTWASFLMSDAILDAILTNFDWFIPNDEMTTIKEVSQ